MVGGESITENRTKTRFLKVAYESEGGGGSHVPWGMLCDADYLKS